MYNQNTYHYITEPMSNRQIWWLHLCFAYACTLFIILVQFTFYLHFVIVKDI